MIHEPKWSSNFLQRIFEPFLCFILRTWIESGKGKLCVAIFNFLGLLTTCTHLEFMLTGTKSFLTRPHTHCHQHTRNSPCRLCLWARSDCPECVFLDFPNSLCSLLPSVCSPETWQRVGPGEKRKVAQFPLLPVWTSPLPASLPGGKDNGLSISNILWFNDRNFPRPVLFPPHWEKVHRARILTHFSLHKACLLNI